MIEVHDRRVVAIISAVVAVCHAAESRLVFHRDDPEMADLLDTFRNALGAGPLELSCDGSTLSITG